MRADGEESLTAKGRATQARIVGAAAMLMSGQGVARTSVDDVCVATGPESHILLLVCDKALWSGQS